MTNADLRPGRNLALELVRATEAAALAAAQQMGRRDKIAADQAAVDAMRQVLAGVEMDGVVVIGEGEKDSAPMLFNGESVGSGSGPLVDVAVDPVDGTTLTANGQAGAISVLAVSARGSMFDPGPCFYMNKLAVGPLGVGVVDIRWEVERNLHALAAASRKRVDQLTAVVIDRPRHGQLLGSIDDAGARIQLVADGDVAAAIATAWPDSGVDIMFGVGGTPEGVIAAAAMKAMGGDLQAQLRPENSAEASAVLAAGNDPEAVLTLDDLIAGLDCFLAATGITTGDLLRGVRATSHGLTTHSLVMRAETGTVRLIEAHHQPPKLRRIDALGG